jgi:hypothetical protein
MRLFLPAPLDGKKLTICQSFSTKKTAQKARGVSGEWGGGIGATFRKPGLICVAPNIIVQLWVICSSVIDEKLTRRCDAALFRVRCNSVVSGIGGM